MEWSNWPGKPGGPKLWLTAGLDPMDPDVLLADGNPLPEVVNGEGVDPAAKVPAWSVESGSGTFTVQEVDAGRSGPTLPRLAFTVPVLRVRTWDLHTFPEIGREGATDLVAPPFRLSVTAERDVCTVSAMGGFHEFLLHPWACRAVEVIDGDGEKLHLQHCRSTSGESVARFVRTPAGGREAGGIAYPVTLSLRVPNEYAFDTARFEFRDLPLPPKPVFVPAMVEPLPEEVLPEETFVERPHSWSQGSARGLDVSVCIPNRVRRGERVLVQLNFGCRSGGLPRGVTHFDPYGIDPGLRLHFQDTVTGREVIVEAVDEGDGPPAPPRTMESESAWSITWTRRCAELSEGKSITVLARFPLATRWDALKAHTWEAWAVIDVKEHPENPPPHAEGTPAPVVWTGSLTTRPVPLIIEDVLPRRLLYHVPTRLRLVPGPWMSTGVAVGCLEEDREVVELFARRGFPVGAVVRRNDHEEQLSLGSLPRLEAARGVPAEHVGPYAARYDVEIFETGEEPRYHQELARSHPTYRTLWKRSFRVTATAEEIEAFRR